MSLSHFLEVAEDLDHAGLLWQPEIGDEVSPRQYRDTVSILVDTNGLTPVELRETYLWLPTLEQMILQLEVRQAILFHAGLELSDTSYCYKTVLQSQTGPIEVEADSLRVAMGLALRNLLLCEETSIN